ncbi:hypothetical protein E4T47_06771 [Aureobasidium subglaciale]|nr:hypothetical protein E4T47_06771 [Aureobasidium subglaciale]
MSARISREGFESVTSNQTSNVSGSVAIRLAKSASMAHDLSPDTSVMDREGDRFAYIGRKDSGIQEWKGHQEFSFGTACIHLNLCKTSECLEDNRLCSHWCIWMSIIAAMHIRLASAPINS